MKQRRQSDLVQAELTATGILCLPEHIADAMAAALAAHRRDAKLIAWTGEPGRGKTVAAKRLVELMFDEYPDAEKPAVYVQLSGREGGSRAGQASGVYNVYRAICGRLTRTEQTEKLADGMCEDIVAECRLYGTRLIVVDEAGTQSAEQMRGIAQIADVARAAAQTLTLLFVGMDSLTKKLHATPQVTRRVMKWATFRDWPQADQDVLMLAHSVTLRALLAGREVASLLRMVAEHTRGDVGKMVDLMHELDEWATTVDATDVIAVRSVLEAVLESDAADRGDAAA